MKTRKTFKQLGISSTPWKKEDRPEYGKTYALTGGKNEKCISNGYSWKESEVRKENK